MSDDSGTDMLALRFLLQREMGIYYEQTHGVGIARRLREAARSVSGIDSPWTRSARRACGTLRAWQERWVDG